MDEYKKMYYRLFNAVSDVIDTLKTVQTETEELFVSPRDGAARPGPDSGEPPEDTEKGG